MLIQKRKYSIDKTPSQTCILHILNPSNLQSVKNKHIRKKILNLQDMVILSLADFKYTHHKLPSRTSGIKPYPGVKFTPSQDSYKHANVNKTEDLFPVQRKTRVWQH